MDRIGGTEVRSVNCGEELGEIGVESLQFGEEIRRLMAATPDTGSSFTALLELPANQVMEFLHSPDTVRTPASLAGDHHAIERASSFSVFAAAEISPETSSIPSNLSPHSHVVKLEPVNSDSNPNSSDLMAVNDNRKSAKRKERGKKNGSPMDTNIPGMVMPMMWSEGQGYGNRQQYQQLWHFDGLHQPDNANFITPETSLLSYDSSKDSASLPPNQLKMEL